MTLVRVPIVLVVLCLVVAALPMIQQVGQVEYSHAAKHGLSDVETIRSACLTSPYKQFTMPDKRVMQTCFVGNRVGFRVIERINNKWQEITAYYKDCLQGQGTRGIEEWARTYKWKVLP